MGFVDVVGVATGYIKHDFQLTNSVAQFLPFMALIWFFLFSVPTGIFLDKYGKRNMLNFGVGLTFMGMLVPFIHYSFPIMLFAFILLGIGNTIVQVAANPLLRDVVPFEKYPSYLSLSQFVKAISSVLGPIITAAMASLFVNWKLVFAVYAITSLISVLWLAFTPIEETKFNHKPATFKSCFGLLKNPFVAIMALGIFVLVGSDVGMNSNITNLLSVKHGLNLEKASLGISIYFAALMIGRLLGAILLNWISPQKFLIGTSIFALLSLVLMLIVTSHIIATVAIFMVGLGSANLFPLIFAITIERLPDRTNEISGLLIMAISGGAFIPPIIGIVSTMFGVVPSFFVLILCMAYLAWVGIYSLNKLKIA